MFFCHLSKRQLMKTSEELFDVQPISNPIPDRTNPREPIVVYFSGPIGAGKSTLVIELELALKPHFSVECALEQVDLWKQCGIFDSFCRDPSRWAIEFQQYVMVTRVQQELNMWRQNPNADVYLVERSVFDDYFIFMRTLFENGIVSAEQLQAYKNWWNMWVLLLPYKPSGFVWLHVSIDELMRRVDKRNRESESLIVTREYQEQLISAHELFFNRLETNPSSAGITNTVYVLQFDVEHDYRLCNVRKEQMCKTFVEWIGKIETSVCLNSDCT